MQQVFSIVGMHCGGCVARVTRALKPIADDVEVTLEPPRITLEVPQALTTEAVQAAVAAAGDYVVSPAR
jgi:copper chaperone